MSDRHVPSERIMDILIPLLIILNITLGIAIFVARMARLDRAYAKQVREEEQRKSHFRRD